MSNLSLFDFKHSVQETMLDLIRQGYQIQKEESVYSVEFGKTLTTGVFSIIQFYLQFLPEISTFNIALARRRLADFPVEETRYEPLYLDLQNLILGFYKKHIFPPQQYAWKFTNETSLCNQLLSAQMLIVEYGIKWLEDPLSNIEWMKHSGQKA